jgi:hypothetical protein
MSMATTSAGAAIEATPAEVVGCGKLQAWPLRAQASDFIGL